MPSGGETLNPLPASIKIPSKVFLLGEYGVLAGGPAIVATRSPSFELQVESHDTLEHSFHPDSPTGKLLAFGQAKEPQKVKARLRWQDPFQGRGGFGESTASFVAIAKWFEQLKILSGDSHSLWHLYQKLNTVREGLPPSGADLLAQAEDSWILAGPVPKKMPFVEPEFSKNLLVFSATHLPGRKVQTHEHLKKLNLEQAQLLKNLTAPILAQAVAAVIQNRAVEFGRSLSQFAEVLCEKDLEHPQTTGLRRLLEKKSGVLGAKGCGALMADTLVVLVASENDKTSVIRELQKDGGLQWIEN